MIWVMKIYFVWLLGVIIWNYGFPNASPLEDVVVAIVALRGEEEQRGHGGGCRGDPAEQRRVREDQGQPRGLPVAPGLPGRGGAALERHQH